MKGGLNLLGPAQYKDTIGLICAAHPKIQGWVAVNQIAMDCVWQMDSNATVLLACNLYMRFSYNTEYMFTILSPASADLDHNVMS